jgi:proline iminopeptidase
MRIFIFVFIFIILFSLSSMVLAEPNDPYCQNGNPEYEGELFRWVQTSRWPMYTWTKKPFNSSLPTVLFFNGGPGQTSHGGDWTLAGWNVIFFDQLGISCSKPAHRQKYLDTKNYSSDATAEDALQILNAYGVEKASLLGVSYGTVPATIMTHSYPHRVKSLVLEGTLYAGGAELHEASYRRQLLTSFFESLPEPIRVRLESWSEIPGMPSAWFGRVGFYFLNLNQGLEKFRVFLDSLLNANSPPNAVFLEAFGPQSFVDIEHGASAVVFAALACRELGLGMPSMKQGSAIISKHIVAVSDDPSAVLCRNYMVHKAHHLFLATDYSIKQIPVTYFQGADDGATVFPLAFKHFKSVVEQGTFAQFLLRRKGGHSPLLSEVVGGYVDPEISRRYGQYLVQALAGQSVVFTKEDSSEWQLYTKGR